MAAISSNKTGIRKALRRLFKKKEDTPSKQNLKNRSPEEEKKAQEELDYRRERRQGNKPVNVPKKSTPSVLPAEGSRKLKSQKQTSEKKPQRLVSNQGIPLKFIEETQKAKREEASKPIDEQIKGSVKKKPAVKTVEDKRTMYDKMSFGKAFNKARKVALAGGDKTFYWRGKTYGTNLKKKEEETKPAPTYGKAPSESEQGSSIKASEEQVVNRLKKLTEQDRKVGGMITTARRYGRNKQAQRLQERYDLIRERQKKLMAQYKELTGKNFPDPRVNKG